MKPTGAKLVYVAGPVTTAGPPDWNYDAFHHMSQVLRSEGYEVINPAELHPGTPGDYPWGFYMRLCIAQLVKCDAIVLIDGWRTSKGARLEHYIAYELGMEVLYQKDFEYVGQ